ncbi:MAG: IS1595 family transposase [Ideonella sp.]
MDRFGSEAQCADALRQLRWPSGFRCPRCGAGQHYPVHQGQHLLMQCRGCRHQASLTAGTLMDSTKLPLCKWFLAMYLISQAKTGLSALALMRQIGVSYRTAWLVNQKIMLTMTRCDGAQPLHDDVQVDDAYLGGERPGVGGRGSPNKVPFVAAVSLNEEGHAMRVKMTPLPGFTLNAVADWARAHLRPGSNVLSDGLNCFAGVIDAGCAHSFIVVGKRKPRGLPAFLWVNTVLGNLKTAISGAHKAFKFRKYATQYLGAFSYRFNHRFNLHRLVFQLFNDVAHARPMRQRVIRGQAEVGA